MAFVAPGMGRGRLAGEAGQCERGQNGWERSAGARGPKYHFEIIRACLRDLASLGLTPV
jgi:hypothetical protein